MKFSKGEIAISVDHGPKVSAKYGAQCECTILDVGPFEYMQSHHLTEPARLSKSDYLIKMPDGMLFCALEKHLRKRPSDDDQLFTRWFRDHIITEPLVETMTRTMRNLESFTTGDANG